MLLGRTAVIRLLQPKKAWSPMAATPARIVAVVRAVQPVKVAMPTACTCPHCFFYMGER